MQVAYIAGKYRAATQFQIQANIRKASEVALRYWKMGFAVICPHMNTALYDGEAPDEVWLKGDLELLARCDVVVMVSNWRDSVGAIAEHEEAIRLGKAIVYNEAGA